MSNKKLFELCKSIRLDSWPEAIKLQQSHEEYTKLPFESRLQELLQCQIASNKTKKVMRLKRQAKLRFPDVCIDDLNLELYPSLKVNQLHQLSSNDWISTKRHVLLIGATGLGKTSLACALAQAAMTQEFSVLFYRLSNLLLELVAAQNEGELPKLLKKLNRPSLLIIDDWGNALMGKDERHLLFELVESRDQNGSLLITSQYPVDVWHSSFGDDTLADSVLDRIVHNSHVIELKGDSIRKQLGLNEEGV